MCVEQTWAVIRRLQVAWVPLAAAATVALLAADVVRQLQLGTADAGLAFFAAAVCIGVGAAVAVGRWPERRRMALLILAWLFVDVAGDLGGDWPTSPLLVTLWQLSIALLPATYALMVLAYPSGRLRGRLERRFVLVAYGVGVVGMSLPMLFADPRGCEACAPRVPSLLFVGADIDLTPWGKVFAATYIVLGGVFIALIVRHVRAAPRGARVTVLPLALAAVFGAAEFVAQRAFVLGGWDALLAPLDWVDRVATLVVPVAIFAGIAEIRRRRGAVGDLVVELGSARPGEVRAALARTLGDPSLELGLWVPDRGAFVDEDGEAVDVEAAGRAVTVIGPAGEPLAALVHDERLAGQRPLLEAAGTAARLALDNARLRAVPDAERRRLERDLHDGAQQRLLALGISLQLLRDHDGDPALLDEADAQLQRALAELRDLARGIHPAILSDQGLAAAVRSLTDRSALPVRTRIAEERYPQPVETAAYFVISEGLANAAKHAHARSASVSVARMNGHLVVEVSDDGCGGAAARFGGGLAGLRERVGALDGQLTIESGAAAGTTLRADIPCASS